MNTPAQYRQVSRGNIDLAQTLYSINPFALQGKKRVDPLDIMLSPPLLLEYGENKQLITLSGRRQLLNLREDTELTALVLPHKYQDQQLILSLLLRHRLLSSSLSLIEQAIFCQKALGWLAVKEVIPFLPLLGHKAKPHIIEQLIALLALDPAVQLGLHQGIGGHL